jgi:hypothetical protein
MDLNVLKNEIINIADAYPVILYIGVGAAASVRENLPLDQYQQFPPFLQDMRNQVPNLHVFLLLVDPRQESPPYVAQDYKLQETRQDQYKSEDGCLQTFVYQMSVYNDADINVPANALNITTTLRDLNEFVKVNQISLIYHDFSGRRVALLADYFDKENKEHLDQIVYGLNSREDHGCFFDLTQPIAYLPFRLEQQRRPIIKMFNYYNYIVNDNYDACPAELQKFAPEMRPWADAQKGQIINTIRSQFKNVNLSILRQVRKQEQQQAEQQQAEQQQAEQQQAEQQQAEQQQAEQQQAGYMFNDLPHLYREMFIELFNEKEYDLLYELIFNYCACELDIMAKLKDLDISGDEILTFITADEDPYKWYNNINTFL